MAKPPNHKIGAPLRIIDPLDPAWDADRVNAETDGLEPDQMREHPVMAYRLGASHFDLDAPGTVHGEDGESTTCARDYLRPEVQPRVFEARRLAPLEVATCLDRGESTGRLWAFQAAVKRIEAPGLTYHVEQRKGATDGQMQAVVDAVGYDVVERVGRAVLDASRAPNPSEGKPSGSSRLRE